MSRPNKTGIVWSDREKKNAYMRAYEKTRLPIIRQEIISLLGSKCTSCNIKDARVLEIDHVDRSIGRSSISKKERGSLNYYTRILREIQSGIHNYRILCKNCNWIAYLDDKSKINVI